MRVLPFLSLALVSSWAASASAISGAELIHTEAHGYGRYEVRVQFAPGDGVVSSMFLWKVDSEMPGVYWNELDIEKVGAACEYSSNIFSGLGNPDQNPIKEPNDGTLCSDYHTHVMEWTPDYVAWYLDGVEVRRLTNAELDTLDNAVSDGMQLRFNLWVGNEDFGGNFSPGILPVHQFINWAQFSEYTPGSGDDGSDFSLVWRDDFNGFDAGTWSLGTWASPFGLSVHSTANVTVVNGIMVLSLTDDNALGFNGTPPPDDEPPPNGGGNGGAGGGDDGTGGSDDGSAGSDDNVGGSDDGSAGSDDGAGGAAGAAGSDDGAGGAAGSDIGSAGAPMGGDPDAGVGGSAAIEGPDAGAGGAMAMGGSDGSGGATSLGSSGTGSMVDPNVGSDESPVVGSGGAPEEGGGAEEATGGSADTTENDDEPADTFTGVPVPTTPVASDDGCGLAPSQPTSPKRGGWLMLVAASVVAAWRKRRRSSAR